MTRKAASSPNVERTYSYGPPSIRAAGIPSTTARHRQPAIVSSHPQAALAPNGARLAGSRNTPAPMMLPTTRAAAIQNPSWRAGGDSPAGSLAAAPMPCAIPFVPSALAIRPCRPSRPAVHSRTGEHMRAFIFPGQGSQAVGMGAALAGASRVAQDVFDEVDEALGQNLFRLMRDGPDEELKLTENAQPAIMAHSIAVFRTLGLQLADAANFVAGHSLGEYSALCAGAS